MSEYTDNPAGRLLALVERLKQHADGTSGTQIWPIILDVGSSDRPLLFMRLSAVAALPELLRDALDRIGDLDPTFYEKFPPVQEAFERLTHLSEPIGQFKRHFDGSVLMWLKFCSSELHHRAPDRMISPANRDAWIAELDSLLIEVEGSKELGDAMRLFLLDHIREMLAALAAEDIAGPLPVRHAVERTIGDWIIEKDLQHGEAREHPSVRRMFAVVAKIVVGLSTTWTSYTQLQAVIPTLPALPTAPAVVEHTTVIEQGPASSSNVDVSPQDRPCQ